jgi:hypothetical protein
MDRIQEGRPETLFVLANLHLCKLGPSQPLVLVVSYERYRGARSVTDFIIKSGVNLK